MPVLAVIPALGVHFPTPDSVRLTQKLADGMARYAALWTGRVVAIMRPDTAESSGNLDDRIYKTSELPFEVRSVEFRQTLVFAALHDADVVMLGSDHRLPDLVKWCSAAGKRVVFVTEYSLTTRYQITRAEVSNPLIRLRRYFWAWQQERINRHNIRLADAIQCNGTPTYTDYHMLNANTLLYFDNRVTADMLPDDASIAGRLADLKAGAPLRLAWSGRLNEMKGAPDLIEVARHLRTDGIPFQLDIFGDGPLAAQMAQQIQKLALDNAITMHGVVDFTSELMPFIRNQVDLFVCCHRQGDPSCTYIETFACGVPIAGYANEALQGLTAQRLTGWTTPLDKPGLLAKKVGALQQQPEQLLEAAREALGFARDHTFEREFGARINQVASLLS